MSTVIVAILRPKPEHRDEIVSAVERTIEMTHGEEGCELYALHTGREELVLIEKWASNEALAAHAASPHFAELGQALDGKLLAPMELHSLRPHPAGTAAQGQL
jgi:quinol monooxygenase YgiN